MAAKRKAPRTVRREQGRASAKLVREREQLARLEPGGSPDRPIAIASASVVLAHARSRLCPQCDGPLRIDEHAVVAHEGEQLRIARGGCTLCGAPRAFYFRIARPN